jgi:monooxygenase
VDEDRTDFCIVGAGPAGLVLALLLLRSGVRVTVLERARSFEREYRGEILQPGGLALLDQLGVLKGARGRGSYEHRRFQLVEGGRALIDIDYRRLAAPYNFLLSIPQRHMLEELIDHCRRFDGFDYLPGTRLTELLRAGDQIRGVVGNGPAGRRAISAHCVVGADGRYSKTRTLAGIDGARLDVFDQDVLWFKLPLTGTQPPPDVRIVRSMGSPVLAYHSYPDQVQLGWTLPHRGYPAVADRGVEYVKDQVRQAVPEYAEAIDAHVRALTDLTLLDVFAGCAARWTLDGLLLIGDSAHTHSPIGAQGINLAIQDAVSAHPVLLRSLRSGDASAARLDQFTRLRRRSAERVLKLQVMQSRAMLSTGRFAGAVRPRAARLLSHTPLFPKLLHHIAYGDRPVQVATQLFRS